MKKIINKYQQVIIFLSCIIMSMNANAAIIRFATEATYPPFEYVNAKGELQGFDIDLAHAICKQMNAQCSFSNQGFSSLIPALNIRKFDAVIAAVGITPQREKQIAFTAPYYRPSAVFVAAVSKHYTIASLKNKIIGVQAGSSFEQYLHDQKNTFAANIKTYVSVQEAFLDLISSRVDAVLADAPIAAAWLNENNPNKNFCIVDKPLLDENYFGSGYGIAVRKGNDQLLNGLNKALIQLKANGTYDILVKTYFGVK